MEVLAESKWPVLEELHLCKDSVIEANNKIGDVGVKHLGKNDWETIQIIRLSTNPISEKGVQFLIEQKWPSLKRIKIKRIQELSEETKQQLRARFFPDVELYIS